MSDAKIARLEHERAGQQGLGLLTVAVFAVIIGLIGFVAYNVLPFYYYYYDLKNQFQQIIKVASVDTDEEIRQKLMRFIKQYQMPVDPEDLRFERFDKTMRISLKYQEVFYISWQGRDYTIKTFDFDATTEGKFK